MRERKGSLSVQNSIQTRLSFVMALVMVFVVCINFFIFEQIHTGVDRIDAVFSSNAAINDLSGFSEGHVSVDCCQVVPV